MALEPMNDFWFLFVVFLAAVNPPAVGLVARRMGLQEREDGLLVTILGAVAAVPVLVLLAVAGERIFDFLDIAPETFRIAAGIVMFASGAGAQLRGDLPPAASDGGRADALFPLAIPMLITPALIVAALSYGVDRGAGTTIVAAAPVLLLAAVLAWRLPRCAAAGADAAAKILTVLLVVIAVGLVVDGVRAI